MSVLEAATEAANRIIHGDTNPDDVQLVAGEFLELSARLAQYEEALREIAVDANVLPFEAGFHKLGPIAAKARAALAGGTDG